MGRRFLSRLRIVRPRDRGPFDCSFMTFGPFIFALREMDWSTLSKCRPFSGDRFACSPPHGSVANFQFLKSGQLSAEGIVHAMTGTALNFHIFFASAPPSAPHSQSDSLETADQFGLCIRSFQVCLAKNENLVNLWKMALLHRAATERRARGGSPASGPIPTALSAGVIWPHVGQSC
jgi:hypothetical protein